MPWKTLLKAGATMAGGDTLFIRGGIYDCAVTAEYFSPNYFTANANVFTAAAPCVLTNYPGETPWFINGNLSGVGVAPFYLGNNGWIKLFGLSMSNCRGQSISMVTGCTNMEVAYCNLGPSSTNAASQGIFGMGDLCFSNYIHDNVFHDAGAPATSYNPTNQVENGDVVSFGGGGGNWPYITNAARCAFNAFVNNRIFHGGHTAFNPQSTSNSLFRGNIIHNEVFKYWPSWGQLGGHRSAGGWAIGCVFEGNSFGYAGNPLMNDGAEGLGVFGPNNKIRGNVFHHNENNGLTFYSKGIEFGGWFVTNNRAYNNTFAHNSLGQKYYTNYYNDDRPIGIVTNGNLAMVFLAGATNNIMANNIFAFNGGQGSVLTNSIEFRSGTAGANPDALTKTNWYNNLTGDPLFANDTNFLYYVTHLVGEPGGTNYRDEFRLQASSPCIDQGAWLTTAVGAGSGATTLVVADSAYFWAGLVAAGQVFAGDRIQFQGQNDTAVITAIDPATHTLTITPALTWSNGDNLALAYAGTSPDFGAFEYTPPTPPAITIGGGITLGNGITLR